MKIKITRSFSKKVQLKQYEPIDSFCSAEVEIETVEPVEGVSHDSVKLSETLDAFCQAEVEKTLKGLLPKDTSDFGDKETYPLQKKIDYEGGYKGWKPKDPKSRDVAQNATELDADKLL